MLCSLLSHRSLRLTTPRHQNPAVTALVRPRYQVSHSAGSARSTALQAAPLLVLGCRPSGQTAHWLQLTIRILRNNLELEIAPQSEIRTIIIKHVRDN